MRSISIHHRICGIAIRRVHKRGGTGAGGFLQRVVLAMSILSFLMSGSGSRFYVASM
jgi:hypothetical protein